MKREMRIIGAIVGDKVCGSKEDADKMATELLERLKNQY